MDALLILSGPEQDRLRDEVAHRLQIVQEAPPSVVVVSGDPVEIQQLAASSYITTEEELEEELAERREGEAAVDLTPAEQLFVEGWLQHRATSENKQRVGEGLNWGSTGYEAP